MTLKEMRLSHKLTQIELALLLGISISTYCRIERDPDPSKISLRLAERLANIFDCSLEYINFIVNFVE